MRLQVKLQEKGEDMRLKVICQSSQNKIPIHYRRKIMMMIKTYLAKQNKDLYRRLYADNVMKPYTFSVYLPQSKFEKAYISLGESQQFVINFSTSDAEIAINFYNAFLEMKNEPIMWEQELTITVQNVDIVPLAPIIEESVFLRTLSPIICRNHNQETKKDWFHTYEDEPFLPILKRNMTFRLIDRLGAQVEYDIDALIFKPINMKKTVVKHYEKQIAGSIGTFELEGKAYLLNELVDSGIGSITGGGFGMIEKI
ncbi:CRISPR-associated endoribonuclease Cas6 [Vagococcus lutrae]|uniref:CRISPR-associated endoribonuclease Cas6 n=1 Tax=Vagococcus lutrae TaxID=81947 RepID=UPI002A80D20B|nr:CRISPR-associated endoribonuclease Cas6 [Vagococcus lutrae]MDY3705998.1 CRISPR-associated endoribonuclease Cas6 [Vagococcus lutrae]